MSGSSIITYSTLLFNRGTETALSGVTLEEGEPAFTIDSHKLFIGSSAGNKEIGGGGTATSQAVTYGDQTGAGLGYSVDPNEWALIDADNTLQVTLPNSSSLDLGTLVRLHFTTTDLDKTIAVAPQGSDVIDDQSGSRTVEAYRTTWEIVLASANQWVMKQVENWQNPERVNTDRDLLVGHRYIIQPTNTRTLGLTQPFGGTSSYYPTIHVWVEESVFNVTFTSSALNIFGASSYTVPANTPAAQYLLLLMTQAEDGR